MESVQTPICYDPEIWFSPRNIVRHYSRKGREVGDAFLTDRKYQPVREAFSVAVAVLGIMKLQNEQYWVQLVDPKEGTPDVRTMYLRHQPGQPDHMNIQDIEVVTLGPYSDEAVSDFILRTKLSPRKSYPQSTTILCHIDKDLKTESWSEIHDSLANSVITNDVFLLGRINRNSHIYQLARVHPVLDMAVILDVVKEMNNPSLQGVKRMIRGSKKLEHYDGIQCLPF